MAETQPNAAPQTQAIGSGVVYAGFWLRFVAWGIDLFLSCVSMIPVALIGAIPYLFFANEAEGDPNEIMHGILAAYTAVYAFAIVTASWFYFIVFECSKLQATPGKLALGLRVTDEHGQRITFLRSVARTVSKILSGATLMVGYILAGVTARKQALHDLIAGCLVVHTPQSGLQPMPPPVASMPSAVPVEQAMATSVTAEQAPAQADTEQPQGGSDKTTSELTPESKQSPVESDQPAAGSSEPSPPTESEQPSHGQGQQSIQLAQPDEPDPIPSASKETDKSSDRTAESSNQP